MSSPAGFSAKIKNLEIKLKACSSVDLLCSGELVSLFPLKVKRALVEVRLLL